MMQSAGMELVERQADFESQAGQVDMLQALRSASLPDEFWMYSYKILPCPHGYRHSWTHCPFSHVGETARRRCPRTNTYVPDPCVNARAKRQCPNGDACAYAHNTFEQWLHPARYRTRLCYLGANCRRPTCFFAHSVEELRSVEENESAGSGLHPSMPPPLPQLPIPPPLPCPAGGDFAPTTPLPHAGAPGASAGGGAPPVGMMQPMMLVGVPQQQQQGMRPDMLAAHMHGHGYIAYQARPGVPRSALPQQQQLPGGDGSHQMPHQTSMQQQQQQQQQQQHMHMSSPAPGMSALTMAVRPLPRPHHASPTVTVATMHPNGIHLAPAGAVYLQQQHGGGTVMTHMPAGAPMHAPPPPPPPHPAFSGPYVAAGTYYRGGDGAPPSSSAGRLRSWSNPGEAMYLVSNAPANNNAPRAYGCGEQQVMRVTDASRRGLPTGVTMVTVPMPPGAMAARGMGAAVAPRHMPAPTNRGLPMRRMSTPANVPTTSTAAAAAAAAAVAAMHYPDNVGGAPRVSGSQSPVDHHHHHHHPQQMQQHSPQMQRQQADSMEAAFHNMTLAKPMAAPPPTPNAAANVVGSPYSPSPSSSPLSAAAATASPVLGSSMPYDAVAAAAAQSDLNILRIRSSIDGGRDPYSRPSSSGSATSASASLNVYDSNAAAAALAAVAASVDGPSDAAAAVSGPYRTLLQHVFRSASASAAEAPSMLLPALSGGSNDVVDLDMLYDDDEGQERSSDPGPGSLRAAIRRISNELGTGVACRNSDPGQGGPSAATAAGVQHLLLPLLQSVLTEGLATGQFELVNGQLQFKSGVNGSSGGSFSGAAAAVESAVGLGGGQAAGSGSQHLVV